MQILHKGLWAFTSVVRFRTDFPRVQDSGETSVGNITWNMIKLIPEEYVSHWQIQFELVLPSPYNKRTI